MENIYVLSILLSSALVFFSPVGILLVMAISLQMSYKNVNRDI